MNWDLVVSTWWLFLTRSVIDGCIGLTAVFLIWVCVRHRAKPQLGYFLFLCVLAKTLVPVEIPVVPPAITERLHTIVPTEGQIDVANSWSIGLLMASWLAITTVCVVRFAFVQRETRGLLRDSRPPQNRHLKGHIASLQKRIGTNATVVVSSKVASPLVVGLLRPHVVIPEQLCEQLAPRQLDWVLLHEFAHVKRGDLWVSFFQRTLSILQFYNPVVWLSNWMVDELREFACDDAAVTLSGVSRYDSGEAFLSIVESVNGRPTLPATALGMTGQAMQIRRRLLRLLTGSPTNRGLLRRRQAVVVWLAIICVFLPTLRATVSLEPDNWQVHEPTTSRSASGDVLTETPSDISASRPANKNEGGVRVMTKAKPPG